MNKKIISFQKINITIILLITIFVLLLNSCSIQSNLLKPKTCCLCDECHNTLYELRMALPPKNEYQRIREFIRDRQRIRFILQDLCRAKEHYNSSYVGGNNIFKYNLKCKINSLSLGLLGFYRWGTLREQRDFYETIERINRNNLLDYCDNDSQCAARHNYSFAPHYLDPEYLPDKFEMDFDLCLDHFVGMKARIIQAQIPYIESICGTGKSSSTKYPDACFDYEWTKSDFDIYLDDARKSFLNREKHTHLFNN